MTKITPGDGRLAARLKKAMRGEVLFDAASRGRYSTDASIYQIEPVGVVVPVDQDDAMAALSIAAEEGVPILPRGAGTSQCGQTVGAALVIDTSKHLNRLVALDRDQGTAWVEPGMVLDRLNATLRPHGLWYPVDVSTSAQATLGGMAGNNSCGARSIRYGNMVHNVLAIDAVLADGTEAAFGPLLANSSPPGSPRFRDLVERVGQIVRREKDEIAARYPKLLRRVGGYNLDSLTEPSPNLAHLLVGSEGTLAFTRRIHLKLSPLPRQRALGVCHFPTFRRAMEVTREIVKLKPTAVELVDRTMIELARDSAGFAPIVRRFLKGEPDAILLVEFDGDETEGPRARLKELSQLMADHGLPDAVVEAFDPAFQKDIWEVRKAGLNIMMSMKGDGKPVSFIEDCAVPLEHLADYTSALTEVFEKHGTKGTWYAHASVGCLHVRPVLNMKDPAGARTMRAIAEEAAALVRRYKGAYSGEHGDGLVRSEWILPFFGPALTNAFTEIKDLFDPKGLMNPGKIVRPSKMDDRSLFRFKPGYAVAEPPTALDWSAWGGFGPAVEMCNNNGHCRKFDAGTMCPSYRATGDEAHLTRGRANTLRLAISGQLGKDALASDAVAESMKLCVACKGCKRECPTGVDMARMKIEVAHRRRQTHGLSARERMVAYLPRYAPMAALLAPLANLRNSVPALAEIGERTLGMTAKRPWPRWGDRFRAPRAPQGDGRKGEVALFVDTFSTWFEPENARAAMAVLAAGGYRVHIAATRGRPGCCGRTFLTAGMVEEARVEARRLLGALKPYAERGMPIVGIEPSCVYTLRDEWQGMLPKAETAVLREPVLGFAEFLAREDKAGRLDLKLQGPWKKALVHGHCHEKAFGGFGDVQKALGLVPGLNVAGIESSCCGMAGAFGYEAENYDVSQRMGELSLLPAARAAAADTLLVADGTSCRQQIRDGAGREAVHLARALQAALAG
jgi:FAD/FMN-containing dehydrogenase/Fe-S oxidoreductase